MWDIIIALVIGAAIPIITQYFQSKEKEKYFELERKEKFKLVAIEKRIEAHQIALKQWYDLKSVIHSSDNDPHKMEVLKSAKDFWYSHSLYLEKQNRTKLQDAFWIVSNYRLWLEMRREMDTQQEKEDHKKFYLGCWDDFHKLFEIIQKEVELEPIKYIEDKTPEGEEIKKEKKGG